MQSSGEPRFEYNTEATAPLKLKLRMPSLSTSVPIKISKSDKLKAHTSPQRSVDSIPKLRLSIAAKEGKVKVLGLTEEINRGEASDSENELKIDFTKRIKRKNIGREKKAVKKHNKDATRALNDELDKTVDSIDQLINSSDYNQKVAEYSRDRSDLVKESLDDLLATGKEQYKSRRNRPTRVDSYESVADKVHQDDDYIYLPLADSDDEESPFKHKRTNADNNWSPGVKLGALEKRAHNPSRPSAKRVHVEKGLETAAAQLREAKPVKIKKPAVLGEERIVSKRGRKKLSCGSKLLLGSSPVVPKDISIPSTSVEATESAKKKKVKRGMATPKQRLGKILGLHKYKF